jgi:hypothetical protein
VTFLRCRAVSNPADDAVAFDEWENPDEDEPFDEYFDTPLDQQVGGAAAIAEHNATQRLVLSHDAYQRRNDVIDASVAAFPSHGPAARRERVRLSARLAGDRRARRGEILQQRARTTVSTFSTVDELRVFLAEQTSWDWLELVRPTPAGRPTAAVREQRAELARVVAAARARGAGYEDLARILGRSVATVHALAGDA